MLKRKNKSGSDVGMCAFYMIKFPLKEFFCFVLFFVLFYTNKSRSWNKKNIKNSLLESQEKVEHYVM